MGHADVRAVITGCVFGSVLVGPTRHSLIQFLNAHFVLTRVAEVLELSRL